MCDHNPKCPSARTKERLGAHVLAPHPEQGWDLLCNGVIAFDDGGAILPTGEAVSPEARRAA
ncbi:MAG TPA: DUF5999 family protein [Nocardioidaceae bacterium]|nr:DUF5999 family protein [Nocardioidaceae bacterium]